MPTPAKTKTPAEAVAAGSPSRDDVVRLQIYLDEQNFSPGKIDGRYGGFTAKSWQRFQEARGITPVSDKFDAKTFTSIDPVYAKYVVAPDDLKAIGAVPKQLAEQAKGKALPYTSMAELLGERYHVGVDFLRQLNAGKNLDQLKEGDTVKVPQRCAAVQSGAGDRVAAVHRRTREGDQDREGSKNRHREEET